MLRWVVLHHAPPNGPPHFDWMIDPDGSSPLITFRIADGGWPGPLVEGQFTVARSADHRRVYLDFEGPLSGGRGTVRRVWDGRVESVQQGQGLLGFTLSDGSPAGKRVAVAIRQPDPKQPVWTATVRPIAGQPEQPAQV